MSNIQKLKSAANIRKAALRRQTSNMSNIQKLKSAANIRKSAFPGQRSDMSSIQKNNKCSEHPKSSFSMANIRCVKHPKRQKVLQTCENQLYQGKHPICQTSEKPKSAANIQKPAFPWRTSDMPNIRKTKKGCKHPKSSFSRANIRYVRISDIRKLKNAAYMRKPALPGQHIRNVKHPKKQKRLQTSEKQLFQGKHPMCQTSKKPKCGANMRKPALPGQTSDMANIRKTKKCCNYPKASFTMANIRNAKHLKNQKVLQTSEKQLFQGKLPICQTS